MRRQNTELLVKAPNELMKFLIENFPSLSRNNIKTLLSKQQVSINGATITQFNHLLNTNDKVVINWSKSRDAVTIKGSKGVKIIFEDEYIIVVEKDAGLLSMATDKEREKTAYSILKEHVKQKDFMNKIFIVHRLDRETSGVMIFAKSEEIQQKLQANWYEIVTERKYLAVAEGVFEKKEGTIESYLKENNALVTFSSKSDSSGGKLAITKYRVLKSTRTHSLVEVDIHTGRKNQIRVHLSSIGHPIVGDKKYGARGKNILSRLGLHASTIRFKHPITGEEMLFESPMPTVFRKI